MTLNNSERLEIADQVQSSLALEDILTPVQARSYVRCLQTFWDVQTIKWREHESAGQFNDARRLIHCADIYRQIEGETSQKALLCFRRAGELLEWLIRAKDHLTSIVPIELIAAAAYQLGGLPAMAKSLLAQAEYIDKGSQLYSSFLQADFDDVISHLTEFWKEHLELTDHDKAARLLFENDGDKMSWYYTVELVRCLGVFSDSLRRGDTIRLNKALAKFEALDKLALRMFDEDVSLLITLLYTVAKEFSTSSVFEYVNKFLKYNQNQSDKIYQFARRQFKLGRGILWSSQRQGLNRLLNTSSFALCTPTGSGKTLVAILAIIKELLLRAEDGLAPLCLYLVPSRALASEVETKLNSELSRDFIITGLYGGTDWGVTDYWLAADQPTILIATVEKADAIIRYLGPFLIARLRLLIIDEAHLVVPEDNEATQRAFAEHANRSIKLEALISRLLIQSPNVSRIALTAVAGGASSLVAEWIEGRAHAEAIGTNYRSTRQLIGRLEVSPDSPSRVLIDLVNGQSLSVLGRNEPVYIRLKIPMMPELQSNWRDSIYRFNELSVLWTALHLVDETRSILISVTQKPEQTMGWYKEALELPEWKNIVRFELPKSEELLVKFRNAREACVDYCGIDSYEVFLLDHGIATSHGQMPQRLRRLMTDLIADRICPITIATATLTEGVNLPFDIIFLTSLKRRIYDSSRSGQIRNPLSISEFSNLAGRAGRPGSASSMEGMTLVSVPQKPSSTADNKIRTQLGQIKSLMSDYDDLIHNLQNIGVVCQEVCGPLAQLLNTIASRAKLLLGITGERFLEWLEVISPGEISQNAGVNSSLPDALLADSIDELDWVLLGALEEIHKVENSHLAVAQVEMILAELWQKTFTRVATVQEDWLEQAFIRRGRGVVESVYPDPDERKRLYQYGFPPYLGRRFEQVVPRILEVIKSASAYGTMSENERVSIFISLGAIVSNDGGFGFHVRNTVTDKELRKKWQDILAWWMNAQDAKWPQPNKLRAWQRFVADNFEYRLGICIGAVIAHAWSTGTNNSQEIPSLSTWKGTTGLPWFGFWARELLRWGTLEPFVAFALSQGLARTRDEATELREEYKLWLRELHVTVSAEDLIDPQLYIEWQKSVRGKTEVQRTRTSIKADLTGTDGRHGRYSVIPIVNEKTIHWIDPSGYELALSQMTYDAMLVVDTHHEYELIVSDGKARVKKIMFPIKDLD